MTKQRPKIKWRRKIGHLWQVLYGTNLWGHYGYGMSPKLARLDAIKKSRACHFLK